MCHFVFRKKEEEEEGRGYGISEKVETVRLDEEGGVTDPRHLDVLRWRIPNSFPIRF